MHSKTTGFWIENSTVEYIINDIDLAVENSMQICKTNFEVKKTLKENRNFF